MSIFSFPFPELFLTCSARFSAVYIRLSSSEFSAMGSIVYCCTTCQPNWLLSAIRMSFSLSRTCSIVSDNAVNSARSTPSSTLKWPSSSKQARPPVANARILLQKANCSLLPGFCGFIAWTSGATAAFNCSSGLGMAILRPSPAMPANSSTHPDNTCSSCSIFSPIEPALELDSSMARVVISLGRIIL